MSRALMMSIRPEWCRKIFSGEKTVELRKSVPDSRRLDWEYPFKVLVYCTKNRRDWTKEDAGTYGKVIGEFTCSGIIWATKDGKPKEHVLQAACVSSVQYAEYTAGRAVQVFGFKIENPVRYQRPRELVEYGLSRPPQNWCYVEDY